MTTEHPLTLHRKNVVKLEAFAEEHPELFTEDNIGYIDCPTYHNEVQIQMRDAALAGDVLGKQGWTRRTNGAHYDWIRIIFDVKITLVCAETIIGHNTVVPTSSFPLQLTNS